MEHLGVPRALQRSTKCQVQKATAISFPNAYVKTLSSSIDPRHLSFLHVKNSRANLASMQPAHDVGQDHARICPGIARPSQLLL